MRFIYLSSTKFEFDKAENVIRMSERDVPFDTSYTVVSPKRRGTRKLFEFTHSTGSEWDTETKWVYKSEDGQTLEVSNDEKMTKEAGERYLEAKTGYLNH